MKSNPTKLKKSKYALSIGAALLLSASAFTFASCEQTETEVDNSTVKVDTASITNGNFENYSDDNLLKLINTPDGWSNSVDSLLGYSASTSTAKSGIVNVKGDAWTSLTTPKKPIDFEQYKTKGKKNDKDVDYYDVKKAMTDAEKVWKEMSANDHLKFYADVKDNLKDYNEIKDDDLEISDFEYYSDYNYGIEYKDVPDCENPGARTGAKDGDTGVLMIHNQRSDGYGTAQKYTSSYKVSLEPGTAAELSVWVKTDDLTYANGTDVDGKRGAYINVTHTVGSQSFDDMQIKNIDTKGAWSEYTVYLEASPYATSTFNVVLGLGHGSSSNSGGNRFEYVQGYAFFDDVDVNVVKPSKIEDKVESLKADYTCFIDSEGDERIFETDKTTQKEFVLDLSSELTGSFSVAGATAELTYLEENGKKYSVTDKNGLTLYKNFSSPIETKDDVTGVYTYSQLKDKAATNASLKKVLNDKEYFGEDKFISDSDEMLMLFSANGAPYTATLKNASKFTLPKNEESGSYALLSFWVKTYDTSGFTGATVTLYDAESLAKTPISSVNTKMVATTDIDGEKDINDGWVQCFFFISNTTDKDQSFFVEFSYGNTTITDTDQYDYTAGFAAFTKFEYVEISSREFAFAGSTAQSVSVTLNGNEETYSGFTAPSEIDSEKIKSDVAQSKEYTGVYGGSAFTTGTKLTTLTDEQYNGKNVNKNAGVIDTKYLDAYRTAPWMTTNMLGKLSDMAASKNFKPLLISNVVKQSYGFIAKSSNLSTNGYNAISMKVYASAGAKAYIYLVDMEEDSKNYNSALTISTIPVTYWYDNQGNICDMDPADEDFNVKANTVYELNSNGLYTVNPDSAYYKNLNSKPAEDTYFANLYNYEKDSRTGNLLVKKDSNGNPVTTYNYTEDYEDDGIAFYYKNNEYYAYEDYTTKVETIPQDFTTKYARYISNDAHKNVFASATLGENVYVTGKTEGTLSGGGARSCIIVDGDKTNGKWVTVSFYVRTGSENLPYRLELFSGSRDGSVQSNAGSYILFDSCSTPDLSTNYDTLLSEAIDGLLEEPSMSKDPETGRLLENGKPYSGVEYFTYTFYDDPGFQRYDLSLDTDNVGSPYTSYVQSDHIEGITYFYHETDIAGEPTYVMYYNQASLYESVEATEAIAEEEDEETNWWEDGNFWLMFSSIALAVILVAVLVVMSIVKIFRKNKKAKAGQDLNHYDAKRKHYIKRLNLQSEEDETDAE